MKYVIGVSGTPGAGKSTFCKVFTNQLKEINRKVKLFNLDPGCEQNLAYRPDWNITDIVKISTVMKEKKLGPNGALMEIMGSFFDIYPSSFLFELNKCDDGTFIIVDLPGQVELFTIRESLKNFYKIIQDDGHAVCNVYMFDSYILRTPDFFIAYSTNVLMSLFHLAVPQINLISKMDLFYNCKNKYKLDFPFEYFGNVDLNVQLGPLEEKLRKSKCSPFNQKFYEICKQLAEVNSNYGLVSYLPFSVANEHFIIHVRIQIERAMGFMSGVSDYFVNRTTAEENLTFEYIETFLERCVKVKKKNLK